MSTQLYTLLHKEMTRKEFIATLGLGLAAIFGFGSVVRLLTGKSLGHQVPRGYGSSAYGQ